MKKKSLFRVIKEKASQKNIQHLTLSGILFLVILYIEKLAYPTSKSLIRLNVYGRTSVIIVFLIVIVFVAFERREIFRYKKYKIHLKQLLVFLPVHLLLFLCFWYFKHYLILHQDLITTQKNMAVFIRYLLPMLVLGTGALAFFDFNFIKKFIRSLAISFVISIAFFQISLIFRNYWEYFSKATSKSVAWLLGFSFNDVAIQPNPTGPELGAGGFTAYIQSPCSGIEGLTLFLFLFILIIVIDRKELNWIRTAIMGAIGLAGMFAINILRIYLLYLVAIYYDPRIAISYFHTNVGWMLFITYFVIYWYVIYYFIRKKEFK